MRMSNPGCGADDRSPAFVVQLVTARHVTGARGEEPARELEAERWVRLALPAHARGVEYDRLRRFSRSTIRRPAVAGTIHAQPYASPALRAEGNASVLSRRALLQRCGLRGRGRSRSLRLPLEKRSHRGRALACARNQAAPRYGSDQILEERVLEQPPEDRITHHWRGTSSPRATAPTTSDALRMPAR